MMTTNEVRTNNQQESINQLLEAYDAPPDEYVEAMAEDILILVKALSKIAHDALSGQEVGGVAHYRTLLDIHNTACMHLDDINYRLCLKKLTAEELAKKYGIQNNETNAINDSDLMVEEA